MTGSQAPSGDLAAGRDAPVARDRRRWIAVLARTPWATLDSAAATLGVPAMQTVRPPETGLIPLEGRAGGTGARFILGELTVTRACVAFDDRLGVAYVAGRDRDRAALAARFDALLQHPDWHDRVHDALVRPEAARQLAERAAAARRSAATRVDFSTLVRGS